MKNTHTPNTTLRGNSRIPTTRPKTSRKAPQGPQRRSMRIIELTKKSEEDKPTVSPTAQEERKPALATPVEEKVVEELRDQMALKTQTKAKVGVKKGRGGPSEATSNVESPILKPRTGAGVKKTAVGDSKSRIAANAKVGMEEEEDEEVMIKVESPTPKPRPSMRVTKRGVRDSKSKIAAKAKVKIEEEEEEVMINVESPILKPTPGARVVRGSKSGIVVQPKAKVKMEEEAITIKAESPILKPRTSMGVTKKTVAEGSKSRVVPKVKVKMEEEEAENQGITTTTITNKVAKASRTRNPRVAPQGPQRRSMRIIELNQKPVQEEGEPAAIKDVIHVKFPILEPKEDGKAPKRGDRDGARGGRSRKGRGGKEPLA